jgi:hypothetical protein
MVVTAFEVRLSAVNRNSKKHRQNVFFSNASQRLYASEIDSTPNATYAHLLM